MNLKNLLFLFLSCTILAGCSNDDSSVSNPQDKLIETGGLKIKYEGHTLDFKDVRVMPGGPDSPYDLEMASVIPYEDINATQYSLVLVFNKDAAGNYELYTATLGVDDRQGPRSFYLKGYYAYTSGPFEVPEFAHNTTTSTVDNEVIHITGNFSGTLLPGDNQPEPIAIEDGEFWADFKPFQ
ncbi:MAG: hypothetical protein DI539_02440 [Flavobacterium psychrophilum]|nr:MAG: hypothetical protein DI539_02440 [Flavobacterium psychrophilum]